MFFIKCGVSEKTTIFQLWSVKLTNVLFNSFIFPHNPNSDHNFLLIVTPSQTNPCNITPYFSRSIIYFNNNYARTVPYTGQREVNTATGCV